MPLVERYEHDYVNGNPNDLLNIKKHDDCMYTKAYDTHVTRGTSAAAKPIDATHIDITPVAPGATVLHLMLVDNGQPLQPVGPDDQQILAGYGCDTGPY